MSGPPTIFRYCIEVGAARPPLVVRRGSHGSVIKDHRGMETAVEADCPTRLPALESAVAAGYRMAVEKPGPNTSEEDAA